MIMPPSLVAPFHEDSYNEHFYKNGPFRLHGDHPGPPAAFRKVLELFAGKWGLSFGYLIIRMNDNVQCGFIGQRTKRETRDWRHDEVAVMLMFHDFPRCGAELYADVELNNRAILNGIARLYMMTDLDLEAWLSLCAEDSGLDLGGPQEDQFRQKAAQTYMCRDAEARKDGGKFDGPSLGVANKSSQKPRTTSEMPFTKPKNGFKILA
ncbi:hypothetical protein P7C70_g4461, partial [Phenoliferia sp. Uapishka_3]